MPDVTLPSILGYAAMVFTVVGVWLVGGLSVRGQWVILLAQFVWLAVAVLQHMWGLAGQSVILGALTGRAIVCWRKQLGR